MPRHIQDLEMLKKEGINSMLKSHFWCGVCFWLLAALIILNEHWELNVSLDQKATEFDLLHLPTPDYFSPTPEQIEKGKLEKLK